MPATVPKRSRPPFRNEAGHLSCRTAVFVAAEAKLTKALSLVPDHARGHMTLGNVYMYTRRAALGIAECEHALALDRNLAQAHFWIGTGNPTPLRSSRLAHAPPAQRNERSVQRDRQVPLASSPWLAAAAAN